MSSPVISIIIPTCNRAHLIKRSIRSVLKQKFKNWELIVVDDGSTDDTQEVVKSHVDSRIKYHKQNNAGATIARNKGVAISRGEYVTFLDSDDEAKPEWLELIHREIIDFNPGLICCGSENYNYQGIKINGSLPSKSLIGKTYKMTIAGVFVIKKDIFNQVKGYDPLVKSGQHTELSWRLIPYLVEKNVKIRNINEYLIKIHKHNGSRIRGNPEAKFKGATYSLKKHKEFFSRQRCLKANYESIAGVNAVFIGKKNKGLNYLARSILTQPSIKRILRFFYYLIMK